ERLGIRAKTGKPLLAASWILCRPCSAGRARPRLSPPDARTQGGTEQARTPVLLRGNRRYVSRGRVPIWPLARLRRSCDLANDARRKAGGLSVSFVNLVSGGLDSTLIGVMAKEDDIDHFPLFI